MGAIGRLADHLAGLAADPAAPGTFRWPRRAAWRRLRQAITALESEQRRLALALSRQRAWRFDLVEALGQPALLVSQDARLLAANEAARDLLAIDEAAVGTSIVRAIGNVALVDAVREAQGAGSEGSPGQLALDLEHAGKDLRVSVTVVGTETLVIAVDRTRERQVEELRRNFVVNASHELKTPVTSIQALAEALQVTVGVDQQRAAQLVARLSDDAEHLAQLVRDLLDLRRLEEAGPLERVAVDVAGIVRRLAVDLQPLAENHQVTIDVRVPEHALVAGVPADVEVIVKNLIENAVRYNQSGGSVQVEVRAVDGQQVLTVTDTGIGIPTQDLGRVFERFYRVDVARSRSTGGTGLGLSIVRNAVERQGGMVEVHSTPGSGSTFTVRLPVGPSQ